VAKNNKTNIATQQQNYDIEHLKQRLELLDNRLDNIDSMVTAVAERVMKQPITLHISCPHCGKDIEIAIIGNEKLTAHRSME
jgi:gamma-glutamyl phosphate reductase